MSDELEANKRIAMAFFQRVSDESDPDNVVSAMDLFSDDALHSVIAHGIGGVSTKEETTRKNIEALQTVRGRMKFKIHSVTAEGDRVAVEAQNTSKIVNGEVYDNFYVFIFIIKDGKITRLNEYLDTLYLANFYQRLREHPAIAPRVAKLTPAENPTLVSSDTYFHHPLVAY